MAPALNAVTPALNVMTPALNVMQSFLVFMLQSYSKKTARCCPCVQRVTWKKAKIYNICSENTKAPKDLDKCAELEKGNAGIVNFLIENYKK